MTSWDYTNTSEKKKIRTVLALLSIELNALCNQSMKIEDAMRARKIQGENHPWELEHVLPQSKERNGVFQSIGNLVLLSSADNNNLSSSAPSLKKDHYLQCSLVLTKTLTTLDLANTTQSNKIRQLFTDLEIEEVNWDLGNWDELSISARVDFYHRYLSYVIKSVSK